MEAGSGVGPKSGAEPALVHEYRPEDEGQWLRCRVLAFLDTAYFDNVLREKERYGNPAIELVAESEGTVVGLIDLECETAPGTVCSARPGLGAMIWHLAVHPDHRRLGIAGALLTEATKRAAGRGIARLEAWTRDDAWVQKWYEAEGFRPVESYLHVFLDGGRELKGAVRNEIPGLLPVQAFAHYVGEDPEGMRTRFKRVHQCVLYELGIIEPGDALGPGLHRRKSP